MNKQKGVIIARAVSDTVQAATMHLRCYDGNTVGDCDQFTVIEKYIDDITLEANNPVPIPFDIDVPSRGAYSLFVHIDAAGNGKIDIGDYLTTYTVVLPEDRSDVTVWVDQVV